MCNAFQELVLADLRGKLAAISSELAEAEGELCAGRMAVEQLTRQVKQIVDCCNGLRVDWVGTCPAFTR